MLLTKAVSALEKPFADQSISDFEERSSLSALRGERVSFQLAYTYKMDDVEKREWVLYHPVISGALAPYTTLSAVRNVGVQKPCVGTPSAMKDENYLRTRPGLFPDILTPLGVDNKFVASSELLNSIWIDVDIPSDTDLSGEQTLTVDIIRNKDNAKVASHTYTVDILPAALPEEKVLYTQFFYHACISGYYGLEEYSARHWEIMENYLSLARREGMNTLFTPIALVRLSKLGPCKYRADLSRFKRFLALGNRLGYKKIEISHLFTAGNCAYATSNLCYYEGGEKKKMGGMSATDPEVTAALRTLLSSIIRYMKKYDDDSRLIFHVADEPAADKIENFRAARATIADLIDPYEGVDAIYGTSDAIAAYYKEGLIRNPSPETPHVEHFCSLGVKNLWTYYCCGPTEKYSNRFIAQKSAVTRSIGMQMYKFNVHGFLHWGINYYGGGDCGGFTLPYVDQSAQNWVSAGDSFTLYPAMNGTAYESIRAVIMQQALQDIRAMQLCESLYSKDEVVAAIEEVLGDQLTFQRCAHSTEEMLAVIEKINAMIKARV
jgi:hypothetical protein